MASGSDNDGEKITQLLQAWQQGDERSGEELAPLVYDELRRMARSKLDAERGAHTLQPTALVHEAWLRLMQQNGAGWQNRSQFFAIAAQAMRRILVDHARRRHAGKRGDGVTPVPIDALADVLAGPLPDPQMLALDAALDRLSALDARQARIVELRFFAGLSNEETGAALTLSPSTIKREWATARAWLFRELSRQTSI